METVESPGWGREDVRLALKNREAQLWGAREGDSIVGIWVTRIENSYTKRWGLVWITAGVGLDNVGLYRSHIEPWFKEMGCEFVEIVGRKGWKRIFPDYDEKGLILVKELL